MALTPEQIQKIQDKIDKYQAIVDSIDEQIATISMTRIAENDDDKIETKSNDEVLKVRAFYTNLISSLTKKLEGDDGLGEFMFKNSIWGTY